MGNYLYGHHCVSPPPTHTYNVATDGPVGPIETKINLKEKIAKFCFEKNLVI